MSSKVRVGTSGYNYPAWRGSFYPDKLPTRKMLGFYAAEFGSVEINYTFRKKPTAKILAGWSAQAPAEFRFALKAWQRITHQKRLKGAGALVTAFSNVARTLGPQLGPILYQLPPNLPADVPLLKAFLAKLPKDLKAAFEFRHASWFSDQTFEALQESGVALCIAESEDLATPAVRTADYGYFRLRRTDYDRKALRKWARTLHELGFTGDVFVYFKHEDEARGPAFAKQFVPLADRTGP